MVDLVEAVHVLSVVVWVGGMFFAYICLRPAAASMPAEQRLPLWNRVFGLFFPWVWGAVILILASGLYLIYAMGGMGAVGMYVHLMLGLGLVMMALFMHVFFAPFKRLKRALANNDLEEGGRNLAQIRKLVGINLALGVVVIIIATGGRGLGLV